MNDFAGKLPLLTSILLMGLSTILLFTVFLIARSNYRDRFSSYWLIGWAFYTARSGFEVVGALDPGLPGITSGNLISLCGSAVFLLVAASSLGRARRGGRVAVIAFFAASLAIAASEAIGFDKPALILVVFLICGAIQMATGIHFFIYRAKPRSFGVPLAAFSLLLLGSLNLTYFWVRPDQLLAPLAYQLGTFLRTALGIAVAIILFDSSREEARRSAFRYQALFNSLNDGVFIVDFSGRHLGKFSEVNNQATAYLGYSREELLSMGPSDIEAPEDPRRGDDSPLQASDKALLHRVHATKRGERIPVDISAQVFELDGRLLAIGIARDVRDREASEASLREAVGEREALLRELHHRVKNNLQIIVSLLSLQSATMKDPSSIEALTNSKARVASIALVHELLYSDRSLATIDLKAYAEELANSIGSSRGQEGKIAIRIDGQELRYDIDRAIPVGLILVELVTNAFKYAFQGRSRGIVRVSIDRDPDRDSICVEDDGVGMTTDGLDGKTLGLSLVDMLSKQLGGRIELSSSGAGTSWRLIIPSGPCRNGVPKLMGTPFRFD